MRLTRNQFFDLTNGTFLNHGFLNHGTLNADKKLALTLYYLKDTGSLIITANNFGGAITTATFIIYEVCLVIGQNLGPQKTMFVCLKQVKK